MAIQPGATGTAPMREVVTAFLEHDGKVLLVRRSARVGTYQGRWAGISGYLEREPLDQALVEIREETGLHGADLALVRRGDPLEVSDPEAGLRWRVHPFLFHVRRPEAVRLDWEHEELRWVAPEALSRYRTVPALEAALNRCLHGPPR